LAVSPLTLRCIRSRRRRFAGNVRYNNLKELYRNDAPSSRRGNPGATAPAAGAGSATASDRHHRGGRRKNEIEAVGPARAWSRKVGTGFRKRSCSTKKL